MSGRGEAGAPPAGYVLLGHLGRIFGLRGAFHFRASSPARGEALFHLHSVFVEGLGETPLDEVRRHSGSLIVGFVNVRTPERAKGLVNSAVYAPSAALQSEDPELQFDALIDLPVLLEGQELGRVAAIQGVPGAQFAQVESTAGDDVLIPLHAPYVTIREDAVELTDPPEGLLPESATQ